MFKWRPVVICFHYPITKIPQPGGYRVILVRDRKISKYYHTVLAGSGINKKRSCGAKYFYSIVGINCIITGINVSYDEVRLIISCGGIYMINRINSPVRTCARTISKIPVKIVYKVQIIVIKPEIHSIIFTKLSQLWLIVQCFRFIYNIYN